MVVTRKALLIANPGEVGSSNYCKGVYVDIKNYQSHLMSNEGGAWDVNDIIYLNRPTVQDVRDNIDRISFHDYAVVMFTGHGWYSAPDRDRILELRKGESIASLELLKGSRRRTVILDCCQKVYQESLKEKVAKHMTFANEARALRRSSREACRNLFLDSVMAAPSGVTRLTSCAIDEVSGDDDNRGGRYNGSLFECAEDWILKQTERQTISSEIYSVVDTHQCAEIRTRQLSGGTQKPIIEKSKTGPYFPFAVFA